MRLNNREKIPLYNFYNILFIGIVLLGIGLFILEKIKFKKQKFLQESVK